SKQATCEMVDPHRLVALRVLPEELVELSANEEDDRRDVEVCRHDEQEQEVPGRRLVVGDALQEPGVDRRLEEPRDHDQRRADAGPAGAAVLDGREASDDADREAEEDGARGPAQDRDEPVRDTAARAKQLLRHLLLAGDAEQRDRQERQTCEADESPHRDRRRVREQPVLTEGIDPHLQERPHAAAVPAATWRYAVSSLSSGCSAGCGSSTGGSSLGSTSVAAASSAASTSSSRRSSSASVPAASCSARSSA